MNSKQLLSVFCGLLVGLIGAAQPAPPGGPPFIITEIMYNPPEVGIDSLEFIELQNPSTVNERNLGGYAFVAGVEYTFPGGLIIQPRAYVIVAIDSVAFENTFGIPAFQWTSGALSNNGETLMLENVQHYVVDSVVFQNTFPWPTEADGNGASLVLCDDSLDNSGPENWTAAITNTGIMVGSTAILANPGAACSVGNSITEVSSDALIAFPNPNRGIFSLKLPRNWNEQNSTLRIYDLSGKMVFTQQLYGREETTFNLLGVLHSGTYLLSLTNKKNVVQQGLVIVE